MSIRDRLSKLARNLPTDILLFDCEGKILYRHRANMLSRSVALDAFIEVKRLCHERDPAIFEILRQTAYASPNFGRLHEVLKALLPAAIEERSRTADETSALRLPKFPATIQAGQERRLRQRESLTP